MEGRMTRLFGLEAVTPALVPGRFPLSGVFIVGELELDSLIFGAFGFGGGGGGATSSSSSSIRFFGSACLGGASFFGGAA